MTQTPVDIDLDGKRLVICSNREPFKVTPAKDGYTYQATLGGLVSALIPIMRATGGLWISWSGTEQGKPSRIPEKQLVPGEEPTFLQRRIFLTEKLVNQYYYGFANQALWPLCHYFLERSNFRRDQWEAYKTVNRMFVNALLEELEPENDLLWLQDYHLALAGGMLKHSRPDLKSGIFWHIPFPHPDFFKFIPWRVEILEGMLGNDVLGFHLPQYCRNFGKAAEMILGYEWDPARFEIHTEDRTVKLLPRGIGVNFEYFNSVGGKESTRQHARDIKSELNAQYLILGVDRLDYTKGIKERLLTLEQFFEDYPDYLERVSFLQIAVPSRTHVPEYQELKEEIDYHVGRINGKFSREGWIPIHYYYHGLPQEQLIAYYRAADVALITPIQDGMNLVAKEFAASRPDEQGALILGEHAGAALEFPDIVAINPFDLQSGAMAIRSALEMSEERKRTTMRAMRAQVRQKDLRWWINENLAALREIEG